MLDDLLAYERVDKALREAEKARLIKKLRGHEKIGPSGSYPN